MIKKFFIVIYLICYAPFCFASTTASQQISAVLTRAGGGGGTGAGATGVGGIVAGGVVGGTAVSGATALAFAPLLLAGLEPNGVICAAAPLGSIAPRECYLNAAIKSHGGDVEKGLKRKCDKFYFAQNDCEILNGSYDVDALTLPSDFLSANKIKIKITIASQPYSESKGNPDFKLGIYKDIARADLNKKFETQQFLHHYLMKKYEIPLKITQKTYSQGIQKLYGVIDTSTVKNNNLPLQVVVRYTSGGFHMNLKKISPKTLRYAYLIEFIK